MSGSISRPDLPVLTSLRFIAAAVVVMGHLGPSHLPFLPEICRGWLLSGYEAVTFFFVLSGFILVYVYSGAREEDGLNAAPAKFMIARLARIGPAYYLGLLLLLYAFIYGFLIAKMVPLEQFVPAIILVPTLLQAWYPPVSFSWNGPAWSLSAELFFYTLFPVLLRETNRLSRGRFCVLASCAVIATAALRIHISPAGLNGSTSWQYFALYFPVFHLPSFVFGMALGRMFLFGRVASPGIHKALFLSGALALMLLLGFRSALPAWLLTDASLVPLYGMVIFGAARLDGHASKLLAFSWLVLLGEASYSIYILHAAVIFWWRWITPDLFAARLPETAEFGIVFALVVGISVLTFLFFERPLRRSILRYCARSAGSHAASSIGA
jgi:peptidoglycan/LPS O-acetylase OafA/YrhL